MSYAGPEFGRPGNPESRVVLFKLGGSLLTLPDVGRRVQAVLQQRPHCHPLIVVGGGAAADVVREWDRLHHLGDGLAHQLAIKAMTVTTFLAAALLERARVVANLAESHSVWDAGGIAVLQVEPILAAEETRTGERLPRSWDVTSDSIAAWLAARVNAAELVLLKSADFPVGGLDAAVRSGVIDRCFPSLPGSLPRLTWVNLRSSNPRLVDCCQPLGTGCRSDA